MTPLIKLLSIWLLFTGTAGAQTCAISAYNAALSNGGGNAQAPGQQVTTPAGGPWDNIAFNFYDSTGAPWALQTLYLLSQPYTGLAGSLNASTPGYISLAAGGNGVYTFPSGVTLQPQTAYYFYTSALPGYPGLAENFNL